MKIFCPCISNYITQPFGANYVDFYAKLGIAGHNGIDYRASTGTELRFNIDTRGEVIEASDHPTYGKKIVIRTQGERTLQYYKHYYGHLLDFSVKAGDFVDTGDLLGHCDNSGVYTTGSHLHYGLYECTQGGLIIHTTNGYGGALDPKPFYKPMFVCEYLAKQNQAIGILQTIIQKVKELIKLK
jgi:murein DD-endopeptidase MepM/ murein hydrolase activator NlpD